MKYKLTAYKKSFINDDEKNEVPTQMQKDIYNEQIKYEKLFYCYIYDKVVVYKMKDQFACFTYIGIAEHNELD